MTHIPNPEKPSEIDEIWNHLQLLRRCEIATDKFDVEGVAKWLRNNLGKLETAFERLDNHVEDIYPGSEYQAEVMEQEGQRELNWSYRQSMDRRESA